MRPAHRSAPIRASKPIVARLRFGSLLAWALIALAPLADAASAPAAETAWKAGSARAADELTSPIRASIYSLPSSFASREEAERFLAACRRLDARRDLVVVTDLALDPAAVGGPLVRLPTAGPRFSPWPRDPLALLRRSTGGVLVLVRPNVQRGREADAELGRFLAERLPAEAARAWGGVAWATSPQPFHNGQQLLTARDLWLSLHTLEPHILARLGLARVPVESFTSAAGIDRYLAAARAAAAELAALFARAPRFVHRLPERGELRERSRAMQALGGGAGFDLDSYLTLLPSGAALPSALVGDLARGGALLDEAAPADLDRLAAGYALAERGEAVRRVLRSDLERPRARALAVYLDAVAGELATRGLAVARLPLLLVATERVADGRAREHSDFLVGWNNVVVERRDGACRAEGFASLLAAGDARAAAIYSAAGCRLDLLPPLVASVVAGGGYRCASNHLRD